MGRETEAAVDPDFPEDRVSPQDRREAEDAREAQRMGNKLNGCLPRALLGMVVVLAVLMGVSLLVKDDEPDARTSDSPTPSSSTTPTSTPTEEPVDTDTARPPDEKDLPPGAVLYVGNSGSPIGCIACDGEHRLMSVQANGVVVGLEQAAAVSTLWKQDGQVLSFGARLHGPNKGQYGINIFIDGTTYGPGANLVVGQRSAVRDWSQDPIGTLRAGQHITILVGESGHIEAKGTATMDWWFVFSPAVVG